MLVEFISSSGQEIAINPAFIVSVHQYLEVRQWHEGYEQKTMIFPVAGMVRINLDSINEEADVVVIGNYRDVVFKIQEAQLYGQG
jgi:hypothetical protein